MKVARLGNRPRGEVVLEAKGLSKSYGPIEALKGVDVVARRGTLTAIVGDNGAGKTTLMKILSGALRRDEGELILRGAPVSFASPLHAREAGIETVYQELALAPNLDAVANIFLGRELIGKSLGIPLRVLDGRRMRRLAGEEIERLDVRIPSLTGVPVGQMSGGQRQAVAIARAAFWASDVLLMDEPTAALGVAESRAVLKLVRKVLDDGMAVIMISHVMPHVIELADHVVVLRHGEKVADVPGTGLRTEDIVKLIVGDRDALAIEH
jgi:simple sugar transport system ATP-binding protein